MAQPTPYNRDFDFEGFQSGHPTTPLPGDKVNDEFDLVDGVVGEILARIALLQEDDLALKRGSVGYDQLAPEIDIGFQPPTTWLTDTAYIARDTVFANNNFYRCEESHTSGTFSTDLAAGKWELVADFTGATAAAEDAQAAAEAAQAAAESASSTATTQAGNAATSANAASVSAGAASDSAGEAEVSLNAALVAQAAAEAAVAPAEAAQTAAETAETGAEAAQAAAEAALASIGATLVDYDLFSASGAEGDATTDDTAAVAALEAVAKGLDIHTFGRVYKVDAVPTSNNYYGGGGFKVGDTITWMPKRLREHPLDGANYILEQPADFNYTGAIFYTSTEARWHRTRAIGCSHAQPEGMLLIYEYSEDGGATWKGGKSIHGRETGAISGSTGIVMGSGRLGVLFAEIVSGTSTWYFTYSDDNGSTWSAAASTGVTSVFPYGPMYPWPTAAGGDDTNGFITYAYAEGQIYSIRTANNGTSWTRAVLFDGRSSGTASAGSSTTITVTPGDVNSNFYPDEDLLVNVNISTTGGTGSGQTKRIVSADLTSGVITISGTFSPAPDGTTTWSIEGPTEVAVARVNDENKWLIFARGATNFMAHKTTTLTSVTGAWSDTGVTNRGSVGGTATVGDSPVAFTKWGKTYLVVPRREDWTGDTANENALMAWEQEATSLYDASGVFTYSAGRNWMSLPDRPTSLPVFAEGPQGLMMCMRVGETSYASSSSQGTRNQLLTIGMGVPPARRDIAPNLLENYKFDFAQRGTSFTSITADQTKILDRWKLHCSASGGGATFDASQVDVDLNLSRIMPHRPSKALRLDSSSSPEAFSGFEQVFYGPEFLHRIADRYVAFQIYGSGVRPATVRAYIGFDYGTSGSGDTSEIVGFTVPVYPSGGLWWCTAIMSTPTILDKTIDTSDCKVTIRFDNGSGTDKWDCDIFGAKMEINETYSRFDPTPYHLDRAACLAEVHTIGALQSAMAVVGRTDTETAKGTIHYAQMPRTPTISLVGSVSDLRIEGKSGLVTPTAVAFSKEGAGTALVTLTHATTSGYEAAPFYSVSDSTYFIADAG